MRPEHENPPEVYYDESEAKKYTINTRIQHIQSELTERALELLNLPQELPALILDIGCGSGLSGDVVEEQGHYWLGLDISEAMLSVAKDRQVGGDLMLSDAGQGFRFRPGSFDGAISISCLQWLCNADKSTHNPRKRLLTFFDALYGALRHGARAVFQFYPENTDQIELITSSAMQSGFTGGLVVDYPNSTKRKKYYLCLFAGNQEQTNKEAVDVASLALTDDQPQIKMEMGSSHRSAQMSKKKSKDRRPVKDRNWVLKKKELRRRRGEAVPSDSKFTARKRRPKF